MSVAPQQPRGLRGLRFAIICGCHNVTTLQNYVLIIREKTFEAILIIRVYNAMGALVGRDAINRIRTEIPVNGTGVYVVKVGNVTKRVMVN